MQGMLDVLTLKPGDLGRLAPGERDALMLQLLAHIGQQSEVLQSQQAKLEERDQAIKFKDAKIEKITFELQRLKRWQFGAHSERMTPSAPAMVQPGGYRSMRCAMCSTSEIVDFFNESTSRGP